SPFGLHLLLAAGVGFAMTSSRLKAVTTPERFGFTRVQVYFGVPRRTENQTACAGDLLQCNNTNKLVRFRYREGNRLVVEESD
ncbi:unnamed protein product, partial [marine sediment metagenome]